MRVGVYSAKVICGKLWEKIDEKMVILPITYATTDEAEWRAN
jgi:hypothetical protein